MSDIEDNLMTFGVCNQGSKKRQSKGSQKYARKSNKYLEPKVCDTLSPCQQNNKQFMCKKFSPINCKYKLFTKRNKLLVPDKVAQNNFISSYIDEIK